MSWGAAIGGAIGDLGSAWMQKESAEDAAHSQLEGTKLGIEEQRRQFNIARADIMPWQLAGRAALAEQQKLMGLGSGRTEAEIREELAPRFTKFDIGGRLFDSQTEGMRAFPKAQVYSTHVDEDGLSAAVRAQVAKESSEGAAGSTLLRKFTMDDFAHDPVSKASFEFGLSEGEKAVQRMFGSRGMSRSGAAVKAATRFATDYTGTKAGESRDRFVQDQTNLYNRLAGVAGTGQTAATNNAQGAMMLGNNISNALIGAGNARGAASIATGNAYAGAFTGVGNRVSDAYWMNRANQNRNTQSSGSNPNATYGGQNTAQDDYSGGYY